MSNEVGQYNLTREEYRWVVKRRTQEAAVDAYRLWCEDQDAITTGYEFDLFAAGFEAGTQADVKGPTT